MGMSSLAHSIYTDKLGYTSIKDSRWYKKTHKIRGMYAKDI